jgi:cell division protein FtsI/penicillin-binding protein 2
VTFSASDLEINPTMRVRLFIALTTTFLLVLTGCGGSESQGSAVIPLLQAPHGPTDVVTDFLNHWQENDFPAMYAALSAQTKSEVALPTFQAIYEDVAKAMSLDNLTYSLSETKLQGNSAAITYNVIFESPIFGTITDTDRIMRLVEGGNGWGIVWSSLDIMNGLAAGSRLEAQSRTQERGNIYSSDGRLLVEDGGTVIALYGSQQNMFDVEECLTLLARVFKRQRRDLKAYFARFNADTVFYIGEVDSETDAVDGAAIDETCGAPTRTPRSTRRYAGSGGMAHVTGYIGQIPADQVEAYRQRGYNPGDLVGLSGIERAYQDQLAGMPAQVLRIISPAGVLLRELAGKQGTPSQSAQLTLDYNIQMTASQALADAFNYAEPNWAAPGISPGAGVVVLDINTGAVLAMASYPFFDPGMFNPDTPALAQNPMLIADLSADSRQPFSNRTTQEQYFPGSTFKIVTTAAAAQEKLMAVDQLFSCGLTWDGRTQFGDTASPRSDWRRMEPADSPTSQPAGDITMSQSLAASCNPFFYEMGARLYLNRGSNVLLTYASKMGLGAPTGIEALTEAPGVLPAATSVEQAINEAIGQGGLQVSILQMARLVAGVANGGTLYRPYLVQRIGQLSGTDAGNPTYEAAPKVDGQNGLSPEALDVVKKGMCMVTTDTTLGTAWFVFEETGYTVCGKTGTAQTGRQQPYGWFVAFAPADNPQIAIAAMVEFSREGSETAAPIVRRILDAYFNQPAAAFPKWWNNMAYVPLEIPEGETGG